MRSKLVLSMLGFIVLALGQSTCGLEGATGGVAHLDSVGPSIDLFTQKGGIGQSEPCPPFCPEEKVVLYARATYNEYPEQAKDVTFEVFSPHGKVCILYGRTNTSGLARSSFRLPSLEFSDEFLGTWTILASVNIADTIVSDMLQFLVRWSLADINNDHRVSMCDAVLVCSAINQTSSAPTWDPNRDVAKPYGIIDIYDLMIVALHYGETWGCP